jgi:hypothetical protein
MGFGVREHRSPTRVIGVTFGEREPCQRTASAQGLRDGPGKRSLGKLNREV